MGIALCNPLSFSFLLGKTQIPQLQGSPQDAAVTTTLSDFRRHAATLQTISSISRCRMLGSNRFAKEGGVQPSDLGGVVRSVARDDRTRDLERRYEMVAFLFPIWFDGNFKGAGGKIVFQGDIGFGPQQVVLDPVMYRILTSGGVHRIWEMPEAFRLPYIERLSEAAWEKKWRNLWLGLVLHFGTLSRKKGSRQESARENFEDLLKWFFEIEGWSRAIPVNVWNKVLLMARNGVSLRFGGLIPFRHGISGLYQQRPDSILNRWIRTGELSVDPNDEKEERRFFQQLRILMLALGHPQNRVDDWIEKKNA